ncbi:dihydrofolate reductase family protein [Egbenema bharatensis]|uniref:dihydrofolate reductase family protein n=1 Tax=Egbenema bharatensis TaxID=3463334 RepID=UPI003A851034
MRKLTYYVACSLDGYIAHQDGSHDGFSQDSEYLAEIVATFPETIPAHLHDVMGVKGENQWFDTVLMGRRTYEVGLKVGVTNPYPHLKQYLFSRSMRESPDAAVELISEDAIARVKKLKQESGQGIWLCGGADLAAALFAEQLIDQLILKINPFLMGAGIPLFAGTIAQTALKLTDSKIYSNGVVVVHYQINP